MAPGPVEEAPERAVPPSDAEVAIGGAIYALSAVNVLPRTPFLGNSCERRLPTRLPRG
jgi:hypothetical protein